MVKISLYIENLGRLPVEGEFFAITLMHDNNQLCHTVCMSREGAKT